MTLAIDEDGVRSAAHMPSLIDAIENVLIEEHDGQVLMPPRTNVISENRFLRLMPAYLQRSGFLGYKSFHGSMSEGVRYVIVLIREADGEIVALIDAAYLTALRTGATSGVAARHLARAEQGESWHHRLGTRSTHQHGSHFRCTKCGKCVRIQPKSRATPTIRSLRQRHIGHRSAAGRLRSCRCG